MGTTLANLRVSIRRDIDMEETGDYAFVGDTELNGYINDGIIEAEREIKGLNEGYFLDEADLALVTGTSAYSLPADIYASKIRQIFYNDGAEDYEIKRLRSLEDTVDVDENANYRYLLTNDATAGVKLNLYPTSRETSASNVQLWYLRDAKQLSADDDQCDIPEFESFVKAFAKKKCLQKEGSSQQKEDAEKDLNNEYTQIANCLKDKVVDEDNKIIVDTEFYNDFDSDF